MPHRISETWNSISVRIREHKNKKENKHGIRIFWLRGNQDQERKDDGAKGKRDTRKKNMEEYLAVSLVVSDMEHNRPGKGCAPCTALPEKIKKICEVK